MNYYLTYFSKLAILLVFVACSKDLDINENPNLPKTVDKETILTSAQATMATLMGGFFTNYGGFMAQYHTQSPNGTQYVNIEEYTISQNFTDGVWLESFVGVIDNLDFVTDQATGNQDTAAYLIAKILRVYMYQVLTDLYGDIPYVERLEGLTNLNPTPVAQQIIYQNLLTTIDEALTRYLDNPSNLQFPEQDILLNSDMDEWIKFANTLKLKMYMRLSYTEDANPGEVLKLLAEDNFVSQDIRFDAYENIENKRNPFSDVQLHTLNGVNHVASNSLLQFYKNNNDPRLQQVYRLGRGTEVFLGLDQGSRVRFSGGLNPASLNFSPVRPVFFLTLMESNFLQSEAYIRYGNSNTMAKFKYEEGIKASFVNNNLSLEQAEVLVNGAYAFVTDNDIEKEVRQVIVQKWAALPYVNNIEAYFEHLRTGYPDLISIGNTPNYTLGNLIVSVASRLSATNLIPQTMWYPDIEIERNTNFSQKNNLLEKNWWNQKSKIGSSFTN